MANLITLHEWLALMYGDRPPHLKTVRRWAREHKIQPPPEKHGRAYYVRPDARYDVEGSRRLVERIGKGRKPAVR